MRSVEKPKPTSESRKLQRVDIHIGMRIHQRRTALGISDEQLSETIGVAREQIQRYECGADHISALCLFDVAVALNVPIHFFFDDADNSVTPDVSPPLPRQAVEFAAIEEWFGDQGMSRKETLELVRTYCHIKPPVRVSVFKLLSSLAADV